jgi:hypothetical protein
MAKSQRPPDDLSDIFDHKLFDEYRTGGEKLAVATASFTSL